MTCCICGGCEFQQYTILWKELIDSWRLSAAETAYVDRQQGLVCVNCKANLRSMALARAAMQCFGYAGLFKDFVCDPGARCLHVLEINEAGGLAPFLAELPGRILKSHPEIDMMNLAIEDQSFDLVIHSDTLEHIQHPVRGLAECRRVLKPGGYCAFTVPMIVDRLTCARAGLPPSYHGNPSHPEDCLVHTEYGADAWKHVFQAGFSECRIVSLEYPAAQAFVGVRSKAA